VVPSSKVGARSTDSIYPARRDVAELLLQIRDGLRTVETDEEREASRLLFDA
jgi:hypothetical protein